MTRTHEPLKTLYQQRNGNCGQMTKDGRPCKQKAGAGTDHPGIGACWSHGGDLKRTISGEASTNKKRAEHVQALSKEDLGYMMGRPLQINPVDAMIWCIRITAGEVQWLTEQIQNRVTDEDLIESDKFEIKKLNVWVRERQLAMDRLVRYSESAIRLGIAEKQVQLAEQYGTLLVKLIRGILDGIHLTPQQAELAHKVVRRELVAAAHPDSKFLNKIHPKEESNGNATLIPDIIEGTATQTVAPGGAGKLPDIEMPTTKATRPKKRFKDGDRRARQNVGV